MFVCHFVTNPSVMGLTFAAANHQIHLFWRGSDSHYATKKPLACRCVADVQGINSRQSKQGAHCDRACGSPKSHRGGCHR